MKVKWIATLFSVVATMLANAGLLGEYTFDDVGVRGQGMAPRMTKAMGAVSVADGVSLSPLGVNSTRSLKFGGFANVEPDCTGDAYSFFGNSGNSYLGMYRAAKGVPTAFAQKTDTAEAVQPLHFTVNAALGCTVTVSNLIISSLGVTVFTFQEAGAEKGAMVTTAKTLGDDVVGLSEPVVIDGGGAKTFTIYMASGAHESNHWINNIAVCGSVVGTPVSTGMPIVGKANPDGFIGQNVRFKVEGPEAFISQGDLIDMGLHNHDSTQPLMRVGENDYWIYLSEGGKDDGEHSGVYRMRTDLTSIDKGSVERVHILGIPDANLNHYNGWRGWMMNLYEIDSAEWLAVAHYEDQDAHGCKEDFRMGLVYSDDGGKSFRHLGFILETELDASRIKSEGGSTGAINIAGGGFRWDDRYMYIYFNDYSKLDRSDRHGAVARAELSEVIASARRGEVSKWFKFYNGKWNEPGLGGRSSSIGVAENPGANLWTNWTVPGNHSTLMFNTYINQWVTFNMKGNVITMYMTPDPLDFRKGSYEVVARLPPGLAAAYFTVMPVDQADITTCGQSFYVCYRSWGRGNPDLNRKTKTEYNTNRLKITFK